MRLSCRVEANRPPAKQRTADALHARAAACSETEIRQNQALPREGESLGDLKNIKLFSPSLQNSGRIFGVGERWRVSLSAASIRKPFHSKSRPRARRSISSEMDYTN